MIVLVAGLAITMPAIHAYSLLDEFYAMGAFLLIYIFAGVVMTLSFAQSAGARASKLPPDQAGHPTGSNWPR
jgi:hypothetical protein